MVNAIVIKAVSLPSIDFGEVEETDHEDDEDHAESNDDPTTDREHIRCACHPLQLVVKDGLKKCSTGALKKSNAIIKHSRHSTITTQILESHNAKRLRTRMLHSGAANSLLSRA